MLLAIGAGGCVDIRGCRIEISPAPNVPEDDIRYPQRQFVARGLPRRGGVGDIVGPIPPCGVAIQSVGPSRAAAKIVPSSLGSCTVALISGARGRETSTRENAVRLAHPKQTRYGAPRASAQIPRVNTPLRKTCAIDGRLGVVTSMTATLPSLSPAA